MRRRSFKLVVLSAVTFCFFLGWFAINASTAGINFDNYKMTRTNTLRMTSNHVFRAKKDRNLTKPGMVFDLAFERYQRRHEKAISDFNSTTNWIIARMVGGGLGNRLPHLVNGMVLAMLTDRPLLLELTPHLRKIWQFSLDFDLGNRRLTGESVPIMVDLNRTLTSVHVTEDVARYFDSPQDGGVRNWLLQGLDYFVPLWQANPHYNHRLEALFPDGRVAYHVLRNTIGLNSDLAAALSEYLALKFRPFMIGIHLRTGKRPNIAAIRTYAMVAKQIASTAGLSMDKIGYHIATDNKKMRDEMKLWLGQQATYLHVNFTANNTEKNPGGSDEDGALDFMALTSSDVIIATHSSSFGQWAAAWSGANYVTMNLRQLNYTNDLEGVYWRSIVPEPCSFHVKWLAGHPEAGSYNVSAVEQQYQLDSASNNHTAIQEHREFRAKTLLLASPMYYHHVQCHYFLQ
ncbi:hypothetical protein SeMB42_g00904 [Synchytrium endobioticum]|nr:hypothetical protein SeMB42_g00904 [Synchytrium endobioticum]